MQGKKHITTILVLSSLVIAGVAAVNAPPSSHKNLQILPKDISGQKLDSIMQSYNKALGIGCSFCHSPLAGFADSLDYAADKNEMKENARKMMRMTIEINKSNFYFDKSQRAEYLNVVSCNTCHRGEPYPEQ
jgi:hypothetical protein